MNWKEIELNDAGTAFYYQGAMLFKREFQAALKFHEPGLAPVKDESGWYHINLAGEAVYTERYDRAFGFYFERAAVTKGKDCFHIFVNGRRVYRENYAWVGNYQQKLCVVRNSLNQYFHIDMDGQPVYLERYQYAGDYYENCACVKDGNGWKHIRLDGSDLNGIYYCDLGIFHKGYATAKDDLGWFHIDRTGKELYNERYLSAEPFYNGVALVKCRDCNWKLIGDSVD